MFVFNQQRPREEAKSDKFLEIGVYFLNPPKHLCRSVFVTLHIIRVNCTVVPAAGNIHTGYTMTSTDQPKTQHILPMSLRSTVPVTRVSFVTDGECFACRYNLTDELRTQDN